RTRWPRDWSSDVCSSDLSSMRPRTSVKDVLEVSSRLAEVRGRIDESEADLRFLHHQVEMSLLTTNISAVAQAQVFGVHWRPLYEIGRASCREKGFVWRVT